MPWSSLKGWQTGTQASAWTALLRSCSRIGNQPSWVPVCRSATAIGNPTNAEARLFFERHFRPHPLRNRHGKPTGLITGYYEPLLRGSLKPGPRYRFPIYGPPPDLLTIDLGGLDPAFAGRRLRGRLEGRTVVPYPDRAALASDPGLLSGSELLWVDNPLDAFFLQIQGSGKVALPDGRVITLAYADNNGRPYRSIGKCLIERGEMDRKDVNLFTIRRWLREHPRKMRSVLDCDPRFVFFRIVADAPATPVGALGVPLSAGRSLAVDKRRISLGTPVWLETSMPDDRGTPLNRLTVAQDTGGAIRGYTRADLFWGEGAGAEKKAGLMKQQGRLYVLLPVHQ